MPESALNWKSFRTALRRHLHEMHGGIGLGVSPSLSAEELERLHENLHTDGVMCPPHEHKSTDEPWELGKVKLKYGKDYEDQMVRIARGELV